MSYAMFFAQIYVPTCSYVQIYMIRVLCHVFLCFVPFFSSMLMIGLHAHMIVCCCQLCLTWIYVSYVFISMLYGQILVFTCLYAWIHVLPCLCAKFLYVYMHVSMHICLYLSFHMLVCLIYALYMFHVIFHVLVHSMPCSRAQTQAMFVMPCAIVALLSFYLSFLCFGLMVRTRSRPYGLCHRPYQRV